MAEYNYGSYRDNYKEADLLVKEGQYLFKGKNYQEALSIFEQAKVLNDRDVRIYIGIGDCLYQLRKYDEAREAYDRAISYDKKRAIAYVGRGKCLHKLFYYEEACAELETAISYAQEPEYKKSRVGAYRELCLVHISRQDDQNALDAYEDMKQLDQTCEVKLNKISVELRADRIELHVREGNRLLAKGFHKGAFDHFRIALYFVPDKELRNGSQRTNVQYQTSFTEEDISTLSTKLVHIYSGKGHAEFALKQFGDARESYTEAIALGTTDIRCFLHMGDLFSVQQSYDDALHYYHLAKHQFTDDFVIQFQIAESLFGLKDYKVSLQAYQKALNIFDSRKTNGEKVSNKKHLELLLTIGDLCNFLEKKTEAHSAYQKALALINTMDMCFLAWDHICLSRPASIWLVLCKILCEYSVNNASYTIRIRQALKLLGARYPNLFDPLRVLKEDIDMHASVLQEILTLFPIHSRAEMLEIVAQGNERQVAHLLICLAPAKLSGLATLVQNIMSQWHKLISNKELVDRFYLVLPAYSIPREQADLFLAQCLLSWREYKQVQIVLAPHIEKARPQRESLWYVSLALHYLEQDQATQLRLLRHFITLFSDDTRVVDAYQRIGDLYWNHWSNGLEALAAYREATEQGATIPLFQLYRQGKWEADLFNSLPDYRFPPVVVIDIECDYKPDAPLGSCVFEVAAVRFKGNTELDTYQAVIQRDFVVTKVAEQQRQAKPLEIVVQELQAFIDATSTPDQPAIIVGHNLRSFDAGHLRAMGIHIPEEQIIDTLELARLLYPDSLHHHLSLLCDVYGIKEEGEYHNALPDARVCGKLLYALGEGFIRRGERFMNGVRALVSPESAFDKAILQPRQMAADGTIMWELDPTPTQPTMLAYPKKVIASPRMQEALLSSEDAFVECNDAYGAYIRHLPPQQKSVVTVGTRVRLERMLSSLSSYDDVFVLPDAQTLLCPSRLRQCIEQEPDAWVKLTLFCLYQSSHNHDAQTLYPLRLPASEMEFQHVRQLLLASCCSSEMAHAPACPAHYATEKAAEECRLLLATHEAFLRRKYQLQGSLIVVDDIDTLQMRFAAHIAEQLASQQLQQWSDEVFHCLDDAIARYVAHSGNHLVAHERIHWHDLAPYLDMDMDTTCTREESTLLVRLKEMGYVGRHVAQTLEKFCKQVEQKDTQGLMHAHWIDIWFSHQPGTDKPIERWQLNGLHRNLQEAFQAYFWSPYTQHILCGTAISLGEQKATGKQKTMFLEGFFGLPQHMKVLIDELPSRKFYIPRSADERKVDASAVQLRPASFLARKSWAESVGMFLYRILIQPTDSPLSVGDQRTLMVTLHDTKIAHAFAAAFSSKEIPGNWRVLSPSLGWTTTKIAERLASPMQPTIAFISPFTRENSLDENVNIEAIGPLRFLNQRDPLVAAHIRMFSHAGSGIPMADYLLPQAMLELKARLSSPADIHIILDSGLHSKMYYDEIKELFKKDEMIDPDMLPAESEAREMFASTLHTQLGLHGFGSHQALSTEELKQVLYIVWELKEFRKSPLGQEAIIQKVLARNDQLVIAATGGGKSLCFQLPAILLAQEAVPHVTLVISPLIALMTNQVETLRKKGIFSAIALNSTLSGEERRSCLNGIARGDYSIIYAAPEQIRSSQFRRALTKREIGLVAFDEAHCVSQWGHDFRTDYLVIKEWIETYLSSSGKRSFPFLALTATARRGYAQANHNEQSTILDIIENLGLQKEGEPLGEQDVQIVSPERSELDFKVMPVAVRCPKCNEAILAKSSNDTAFCLSCGKTKGTYVFSECVQKSKLDVLISLLSEEGEQGLRQRWYPSNGGQRQRGLIYCTYTTTAIEVTRVLKESTDLQALNVDCYHGKMKQENRSAVYQRFINNELDIVVATNAFGMGIDVDHLGFVIHFDIPGTLENYYQEAGRAGRDPSFQDGKLKAHCILLYHENDLKKHLYLKERKSISEQNIERVYDVLHQLRRPGECELVISVADIALLASVGEEQVKTILYYIERYTHINGEPVLKRGENAGNSKRQLRFEHGYQQRFSERSAEFVRVFLSPETLGVSPQFRLNEQRTVVIDTDNLALDLQLKQININEEIQNLLNRHILVEASFSYIRWHKNQNDALETVGDLINDIQTFLHVLEEQGKGDLVNVYILHKQWQLKTPFAIFCEILAQLSQSDTKKLQLFSDFKRAIKSSHQATYELRMKPLTFSSARMLVDALCSCLYMTVDKLAKESISNDSEGDPWHIVDKLDEVPDYSIELSSMQNSKSHMEEYEKRELLVSMLLLLAKLKILTLYNNKDEYEEKLHLIFTQANISSEDVRDNIEVDLYKFRLMEHYSERKREMMRMYAEISDGQYAQRFNDYFSGTIRLLEPFEMSPELTEEQKAIVILTQGYHRIDGPPGSGKTHVLQEHLKYLVEYILVPPDHILVATHYSSAMHRIRSRSETLQKKRKYIQAKTLNAFGDDVFKQYRARLTRPDGKPYYAKEKKLDLKNGNPVKKNYDRLQYDLLHAAKDLLSEDTLVSWPSDLPFVTDFRLVHSPGFVNDKRCLDFINRLREYGIFPVLNESAQDIQTVAKSFGFYEQKLSIYYALYRAYLVVQAGKDFYTYNDQILFALAILKGYPHLAKKYQRRFEHIIIDEYQDLTKAQVQLLELLSQKHHHLMLFGDEQQDIRPNKTSSNLSLLHDSQCHYLTTNFRCVQEILTLAHAVLGDNAPPVQQAARGSLHEQPEIIYVESLPLSSQSKQSHGNVFSPLEVMVDAALERVKTLPIRDTESIGLIVARKDFLAHVELYLERKREKIALLKNDYEYQSHHMKRMLTYFRLVCSGMQEQDKEMTLYALLKNEILRDYYDDVEQAETLRKHLLLLDRFGPDDNAGKLWDAISELPAGPMEVQKRQQRENMEEERQQVKQVEDVPAISENLRKKTIQELSDYVSSHISFLPAAASHNLVLTTIDHAKSQEFTTVFLIGADQLKDKNRWYVAVSRARNRFFCLVDKNVNSNHPILSAIQPHCVERNWPEQQDTRYMLHEYT